MSARIEHDDEVIVEQHEINVTPFIDVMLVLLIIFMVAAPLATVEIPVNLPGSKAPAQPQPSAPLFITLQQDGSLAVNEEPVEHAGLPAALLSHGAVVQDTIYLRADRAVVYGELMQLMDLLRELGYLKIALVGLDERAS